LSGWPPLRLRSSFSLLSTERGGEGVQKRGREEGEKREGEKTRGILIWLALRCSFTCFLAVDALACQLEKRGRGGEEERKRGKKKKKGKRRAIGFGILPAYTIPPHADAASPRGKKGDKKEREGEMSRVGVIGLLPRNYGMHMYREKKRKEMKERRRTEEIDQDEPMTSQNSRFFGCKPPCPGQIE